VIDTCKDLGLELSISSLNIGLKFILSLDPIRHTDLQVSTRNDILRKKKVPRQLEDAYNLAANYVVKHKVVNQHQKQVSFIGHADVLLNNKNNKKGTQQSNDKQTQNNGKKKSKDTKTKIICWGCGANSHTKDKCNNFDRWPIFAQECAERAMKKAQSGNDQQELNTFGFNDLQQICVAVDTTVSEDVLVSANALSREDIILIGGTTTNIFCNVKLLTDFRGEDNYILVKGMGGKTLKTNVSGYCKPFGREWVQKDATVNILSFGYMEDRYKIEYIQNGGFQLIFKIIIIYSRKHLSIPLDHLYTSLIVNNILLQQWKLYQSV
jgi:hypothetical protein